MRLNRTEKLAIILAAVMTLVAYGRIFFCLGILDESQHLGSAFMTSIGGRPFFNELFFQQGSSLLYEPLAWLYYQAFGMTGAQLAFRQLYFLMFVAWGWVSFRYFQKRVSLITAIVIGLIPAVGANVSFPSLNYVTEGMAFFGMGAIFLMRALEERSRRYTIYTGLALFVSVSAYPTYVVVWSAFALCCAIGCRLERRPFWRVYWTSAALGAALSIAFYGLCIWRFGWAEFRYSFEFSQAFQAFGKIGPKAAYTWYLIRGFGPPAWLWAPALVVWWALNRWARVPWVALAPVFVLITAIQEPPEYGSFTCSVLLLYALSIVLVLPRVNVRQRWPELALWFTGLVCAPFFAWSSSMTYYAMYVSLFYSVFAVFALSDVDRPSRRWPIVGMIFPGLLLYYFVFFFTTDDFPLAEQTELMTHGYFAGLHTSKENFDLMNQLQGDIDLCGEKGKTVLFYDFFAAGYMMTDMRPASRSLLMHGLQMSWRVRHIYTDYYSNPAARPDCVFRFSKVRVMNKTWVDNDPKKYVIRDVFWNYLPEESGAYFPLRIRDTYTVYQKKGL